MFRLLIVDDEPYTVDGLFEMLSELDEPRLEIYRAYSPDEAIEWLERIKIDIVLSDIRMPGMTGLMLQQRIASQWPRCKIIFLTGIRDLATAQSAIRSGSVDYILKTEGDEAIVRSIRRAAAELREEIRGEEIVRLSKEQVKKALPLLHKEWFDSLLHPPDGDGPAAALRRMEELDIPLSGEMPAIPVIVRIDGWKAETAAADRMLLSFAVQNIAAELFASAVFFALAHEAGRFVWLLQPRPDEPGPLSDPSAPAWRKTRTFALGTLESVQETCSRLLGLTVSLVCADIPVAWQAMPRAYAALKRKLELGLGTGTGMLLALAPEDNGSGEGSGSEIPPARFIMEKLERLFDERLEAEFAAAVRHYAGQSDRYADYLQVYYAVASLLLARLGDSPETEAVTGIDPDRLMNHASHPSREEAVRFLLAAASRLFAARDALQHERTHQIIQKLQQYIRAHLDGDLSLSKLAEAVYLNPCYLSALYKQHAGVNVSDYIAELRLEKAKELLDASPHKIQEIAGRVGFETAGYFTRFFKKRIGVTPQEYRDGQHFPNRR